MITNPVLRLVVATLALTGGPARAAGFRCPPGATPRPTGDLFVPVDCSTATLAAPALPPEAAPVQGAGGLKLRDLGGRWEGGAVEGFGRYQLLALVKVGWFGGVQGTLTLLELQFRRRSAHTLTLSSAKGPGRYSARWTTEDLPGQALKGEAVLGLAASSGTAPGTRQMDFLFDNGAVQRVRFAREGTDGLRVRVWSQAPGMAPRSFETVLTPSTRESL